ncbi:MAG: hypothetical protein OSB19_02650 [Opitutaceae bacterium]|nr:hypothetical protein [Opitutaceae bacterium]
MKTDESVKSAQCKRCGTPIEAKPDYPPVCNDCYTIYASCCNEWGNADPSECD